MPRFRKILTNFYADWIAHMRQQLVNAGYDVADTDGDYLIERKFFNAARRRIDPRPRKVIIAPDIRVPSLVAAGFNAFCARLERGADLTPHQSRKIFKSLNFDLLLYDWDIHHFHLGTELLPNSMVRGTDEVLFAHITESEGYLIRILPHGSWADFQLIETIHRHWPHLLDKFELQGLHPPEEALTNDEWRKVRAVHLNAPIVIGGRVFASPGGGITGAGDCARAIMEIDRARFQLRAEEDAVRLKPDALFKAASRKGLALPPIVRGRYRIINGRAYLEEAKTRLRVPVQEFLS